MAPTSFPTRVGILMQSVFLVEYLIDRRVCHVKGEGL